MTSAVQLFQIETQKLFYTAQSCRHMATKVSKNISLVADGWLHKAKLSHLSAYLFCAEESRCNDSEFDLLMRVGNDVLPAPDTLN
jgi:hypothetical protein